RALEAGHQGLERLTRRQFRVRPAAETENPLEPQMLERLAGDRHLQVGRVGEVDGGLTTGGRRLREEHLLIGSVAGAPLTYAPLNRPHLARLKRTGYPSPNPS